MLLKYIIVLLIGVALPFVLNYGVAHLIFWFHYRSTIHTNEWFWDNELDDHDRERIAWEESYHHGRLIAAIRDPRPERVQSGVGILLLSLVMIDATLALAVKENTIAALLIASLLIPAILLKRWIPVT